MDGKIITTCLAVLLVGVLIGGLIGHFASKESPGTSMEAQCELIPQGSNGISGVLTLKQEGSQVRITGNVSGLPEGFHGFHVHQKGFINNDCKTAAGHFNPYGKTHGAPSDSNRHVGDLGNINVDSQNSFSVEKTDSQISLAHAFTMIGGRSIVIHAGKDDLGKGGDAGSKKTGNAGSRLTCCNIVMVS